MVHSLAIGLSHDLFLNLAMSTVEVLTREISSRGLGVREKFIQGELVTTEREAWVLS
jgi:hypothetical protein